MDFRNLLRCLWTAIIETYSFNFAIPQTKLRWKSLVNDIKNKMFFRHYVDTLLFLVVLFLLAQSVRGK